MKHPETLAHSLPAISDPSAMADYGASRHAERDALLELVNWRPGMVTLDVQSAAGFLSDAIRQNLGGDVTTLCLEPSDELRQRLSSAHTAIDNPVEHFTSVADQSVDAVLGLVGLHHSQSHGATIRESFRVLKPGGQCAYCEVESGSNIARWLNDFVDANNPAGHEGNFVEPGAMAELFREAGFESVTESRREVPWRFNAREDIPRFFRGLFGLACSEADVAAAMADYFTVRPEGDHWLVDWHLQYCVGTRPL